MTYQQILEKAIQKAIDGGWLQKATYPLTMKAVTIDTADELGSIADGLMIKLYDELCNIENIIFNHDFAKALWGEYTETMTVQNNTLNVKQVIDMDGWRYHLQQMVIADDPIKYLGDNI